MYWSLVGVIVAIVALIAIGVLAATQTISLSSGGIVAGVIAAFILLFVSGFFLYRDLRARAISSAGKAMLSSSYSSVKSNDGTEVSIGAAKEASMVPQNTTTPLSYHGWSKQSQQSMRRSSHRLQNLADTKKDGEKEKATALTPEQIKLFKAISKQVKEIQKKQKAAAAEEAASKPGSAASEQTAVPTEMQKRLNQFKRATKAGVSFLMKNQDQLLAIAKEYAKESGDEKLLQKVAVLEQLQQAHAEA